MGRGRILRTSHEEKERKREQVCDVRWAVLQGRANEAPLAIFHWNRSSVKRRRHALRRAAIYMYITLLTAVCSVPIKNWIISMSERTMQRIISQFKTPPPWGLANAKNSKDIALSSEHIQLNILKLLLLQLNCNFIFLPCIIEKGKKKIIQL